ncbi:hypothetical protein B0O99DRAFT_387535 [Bisporella sp. PMI_857]|nr:hypothetical protein B0O99DRAFT_387535 [Bisporella sp. PMI_857]
MQNTQSHYSSTYSTKPRISMQTSHFYFMIPGLLISFGDSNAGPIRYSFQGGGGNMQPRNQPSDPDSSLYSPKDPTYSPSPSNQSNRTFIPFVSNSCLLLLSYYSLPLLLLLLSSSPVRPRRPQSTTYLPASRACHSFGSTSVCIRSLFMS